MIKDTTQIKTSLHENFYSSQTISDLCDMITDRLECKCTHNGNSIQFKVSKRVARREGFEINNVTSTYLFISSILYDWYKENEKDLPEEIVFNDISYNIAYLYRMTEIGTYSFILDL